MATVAAAAMAAVAAAAAVRRAVSHWGSRRRSLVKESIVSIVYSHVPEPDGLKLIRRARRMVTVISPELLSADDSAIDEGRISRTLSLIEHFSVERKRVARAQGRPPLFGDTGTIGKVSKYLNKLNGRNFVVVAHGIFRLLVDDSSVSAETVFDHIMEYASGCQDSVHFARVCADLSRMYLALPQHIERRIAATHATLGRRNDDGDGGGGGGGGDDGGDGDDDGGGDDGEGAARKSAYMAYLEDVDTRRRAIGCFVFVTNLHLYGVVSGSLLADQCGVIADIVGEALSSSDGEGGDDGCAMPKGRQDLIDAYGACLQAMVAAKNTRRVLRDEPRGRAVRRRILRMLAPFDARLPRARRFTSKVWYRLVELRVDLLRS